MRRFRDPAARVLAALDNGGRFEYEQLRAHTGLGGLEVVRALELLEREGRVHMERKEDRLLWQQDHTDLAGRFSKRPAPGPEATLSARS